MSSLLLPRAAGLALLGLALAAASVLAAGGARGGPAAEPPTCKESFDRVQQALQSRSADAVVGCMPAEGTLTLALLGLTGRAEPLKREQALRVLKTYFEFVLSAQLKAREGQQVEALVRVYDYTRRHKGGDPATTRLTVTLRRDASGVLRLHSLVETAR